MAVKGPQQLPIPHSITLLVLGGKGGMMRRQICSLRAKFGVLLLWLLWAHVPLMAVVAVMRQQPLVPVMTGCALLAACYHLSLRLYGMAPVTRYISAIALIGQPALLVFLFHGHPWQMDMHMYFFAVLALLIGWLDRRPIFLAAMAIALHHVILFYLLDWAVFHSGASLSRVGLHAAIVMFQAGVLVWISELLVSVFQKIERMQDLSVATNLALDQRRREAEEANSAKSMFLANMSHEIRTPLNAVLGFCQLLQRTTLDPRQQDYLGKISNSGGTLLRLINDILDFSKNEAGKLVLEEKAFDPRKTVELQVDYLLSAAQAKGISLRVDVGQGPVGMIGDELRFAQVVLNLLGNAVKFTEEGGVVLTLREGEDAEGKPLVQLRISDTGIGIPAAQQDKLFTSFTQADTTTTRRFGGTGLGLAISRQIIEQMGGEISVESKEWHGTTFFVTLPLMVDRVADWSRALERLRHLRLLVVDDNAAQCELVTAMLRDDHIAIETACSGLVALEMITAADGDGSGFDIVLLDWKMPGMDGIELARLLKANVGLRKHPKLILTTGYATEMSFSTIEPDLFATYLAKPLVPKVLITSLAALVDEPQPVVLEQPQLMFEAEGQKLLLVEDNPINREIALSLLGDLGFVVDVAEDGREACDKVLVNGMTYAAVLMDVQMPVMDGIAATKEIRSQYGASQLPVIAMTAHAYPEERERCLDAGMVDHIAKPIDHRQLVEALHRHMIRRSCIADEARFLDIDDALDRVSGKKELLHKLLLNFFEQYHDAAPSLRDLVKQGNFQDAHRLCHNLKAVAGALGMPFIGETVAEIDVLLKSGEVEDAAPWIARLGQDMGAAIEASTRAPLELSPEILKDRLEQCLQQKSPAARLVLGQLAYRLAWDEKDLAANPLTNALERSDFQTALLEFGRLTMAVRMTVS